MAPLRFIGGLLRSWCELTAEEQKAVLTVIAIFLLGLAMRCWHTGTEETAPQENRTVVERTDKST